MDYQRIYNEIISRARKENRAKLKRNNPNYVYYENHHIIPRCMNGTDNEENLVLLTAREHYVMHKLLVYIYPRVAGLASAVFFLTHTGNQNNRRKISSRDYENAKKLIDDNIIEIGKKISKGKKGKKFTEKQWESFDINGERNPMFGKRHSPESKQKIRDNLDVKGEKNGMFGRHHTEEAKNNMSKGKKALPMIHCEYCNESFIQFAYKRYHGENCKVKKIFDIINILLNLKNKNND